MSKQLRKPITEELHRRHGYKVMEVKIKPVHIANALLRAEHQCIGRMPVLEQLFEATLTRNSIETRVAAVNAMLESQRDRWGALGQVQDVKSSPLMTKVLPLIRTLLGADGAAFGSSPQFSSFSSPTALTVTGDPSDDGAGPFIHALWGGRDGTARLPILDLLADLSSPSKPPEGMDDLSALLAPLVDSTRPKPPPTTVAQIFADGYSPIEQELRAAAQALWAYETKLRPNPISSLQRIVVLAALSVFMHGATRGCERAGGPARILLLDATSDHYSEVARASTGCVAQLIGDAVNYMASVINDLLSQQNANWPSNPLGAVNALLESAQQAPLDEKSALAQRIRDIAADFDDPEEIRREVAEELLRQVEGNQRQGLDGYLRLLGIRAGFLYPAQKNPNKRLNPADRTLEVLVASTIDVGQPPLEYRDFLAVLRTRWSIVVGGRPEDAGELDAKMGMKVPLRALRDNSDRFLDRLESLGLARRLADSVAVVGLLEAAHE
jgi:hypothetical protein